MNRAGCRIRVSFYPLLGGVDGFEAFGHTSQRFVEDIDLFAALLVGRLGGAARPSASTRAAPDGVTG